jgi:CheY-like chemotaxis protein
MSASQAAILIVDDDSRNIFALSAVLRAKKYTCITAPDMQEATRQLIARNDIGIVLLDMMMPEMDGYEAIPIIRALTGYSHIPIIAVTAQAMKGDRERCLQAGANGYISKPVNIDDLLELLNEYLKHEQNK